MLDQGRCRKTLIVTDDSSVEKIITRYLNKAGIGNFAFTRSNAEVLLKAAEHRPDLILIDAPIPCEPSPTVRESRDSSILRRK